MIGGVQNIGRITELRQRILFTFAMLAVYRLGAFIVTPGINADVIRSFFERMAGTMLGLFAVALKAVQFEDGADIPFVRHRGVGTDGVVAQRWPRQP